MYFNGIPQGFGQGTPQEAPGFMNKPVLGYTQGIGAMPNPQNRPAPAQPAPQLGNVAGPGNMGNNNGYMQQPPQPQQTSQSGNSTTGLGGKSITPLMPYSKPQRGQAMAGGGVVQQTLAKGGIVSEGIAALRGQHDDPRAALDAYDQEFGPEATAELIRSYADGGVVSGPGSGVADLIPGSIDGREDVRIASGEYVIPAWAVAALGDGSTEAGAAVLDDMVARLRQAGSELIMGSDPIKPNEFLPA